MKHAVLAIAATFTLAACAGAPPRPAPTASEEERPFIERSLVLAPERAGQFSLVRVYDFEGRPDAGVGLRYQHADVPEMVLDLFVFPVGRLPSERALDLGMESTRADLAGTVAQGAYSDIVYDDEVAFDLATVDADGSAGPVGEPGPTLGRRQAFRYVRAEGPMDSLIFMFHRGLFLTKGRASVLPKRLPRDSFDRLANHAMATIVPLIEVRSTGGCAEQTIEIDPDLPAEDFQAQLLAKMEDTVRQAKEEGCVKTLDEAVPPGMRGQLLAFPPDMWRAR